MKTTLVVALLALLFSSCDQETVIKPNGPPAYIYRAFDSSGALVVNGQLRMTLADTFSGTWLLSVVPGGVNVGPQNGAGNLHGQRIGDTVYIGLNPNMIDNNVFLVGRLTGGMITGRWEYVGFPGVINGGAFTAAPVLPIDKSEPF